MRRTAPGEVTFLSPISSLYCDNLSQETTRLEARNVQRPGVGISIENTIVSHDSRPSINAVLAVQYLPQRRLFPSNEAPASMGGKKWNFDKEAASWDKNPWRVKLANDIADAISYDKILTPGMDVLEFGCGTGLLTLRLHPLVHSITGVDSSPGMLAELRGKIEKQDLTNIKIKHLDPAKGEVLEGSYDLVVCGMTLHHVREIVPLINEFFKITAPNGCLCIADLDPDYGLFHGDNDTVFHNGFDRASLRQVLEEAGFVDIRDRTAATVMKPAPDGEIRFFGVFLIIARKRP